MSDVMRLTLNSQNNGDRSMDERMNKRKILRKLKLVSNPNYSENNQKPAKKRKRIFFTVDFVYFCLALRNCIISKNKWVITW